MNAVERFGVTGGRDYKQHDVVEDALLRLPRGAVLVHGAAPGADNLAASWWGDVWGETCEPHPADWDHCDANCYHAPRTKNGKNYCPAAGPRRNQEMVDSGLDLLVKFPGGDGTADMVRRAQTAGVPVLDALTGSVSS